LIEDGNEEEGIGAEDDFVEIFGVFFQGFEGFYGCDEFNVVNV